LKPADLSWMGWLEVLRSKHDLPGEPFEVRAIDGAGEIIHPWGDRRPMVEVEIWLSHDGCDYPHTLPRMALDVSAAPLAHEWRHALRGHCRTTTPPQPPRP